MCRILVRYKERPRSLKDTNKHERNKSWRGDPIVVMDDGHDWGLEEGLPNYVSLDLEGVPKEKIQPFIGPEQSHLWTPTNKVMYVYKRAYNINIDALPEAVKDGLRRDGFAKITWAELTGHIIHKLTGSTR